jgi:hypothetical protein
MNHQSQSDKSRRISFYALTTGGRSFGAKNPGYQQWGFYACNDRLAVAGAIKLYLNHSGSRKRGQVRAYIWLWATTWRRSIL